MKRGSSKPPKNERLLEQFSWIHEELFPIGIHDTEGRIVDVNDRAAVLLGWSREEFQRLRLQDCIEDFDSDAYARIVASVNRGLPQVWETAFRRKDGAVCPVEVRAGATTVGGELYVVYRFVAIVDAAPATGAPGDAHPDQHVYWDAVIERQTAELRQVNELLRAEIAERRNAYQNLLEERELLRTLIDNLPDHIFVKDNLGRYIIDNRTHALFLGAKTSGEVIGRTVNDFFPRDMADKYHRDDMAILRSGRPLVNREEPILDRGGKPRWVSTSKIPIRNDAGKIFRLVCISRDITELKLAEDALERERNLLRTLIDNMPDFIYVKDSHSRFEICNQAHAEAMGYQSPAELIGKTDYELFPEDLAGQYFKSEQQMLRSGQAMVDNMEPTVDRQGAKRWLSTTKVPLKGSRGKFDRIVGISRDVTERKKFEDALRKAKDELEIRVEERTVDLKKANERLEVRINQLHFLNRMSYELAQYIDVKELYPAILKAFISRFLHVEASLCTRAEAGFVCVAQTGGLDSDAGRRASERALSVFDEHELSAPFMAPDWSRDQRLAKIKWPAVKKLPVYVSIPFIIDGRLASCLQIFTTPDFSDLYDQENPLLATLAAHASVCQSNARYYQELGEKARLEGELDAARNIQRSFTPEFKPSIPHIDLKGVYYPAFEVGGDYLDYFENERGDWVVVIADVCGKGIPAALLMTVLRSTFRVEARTRGSAKELLCAVNESMKINLDNRSFVTALCLIIDREGRRMTYSRAGHPMLLQLGGSGESPSNVPCAGLALGLAPDSDMFVSMLEEVAIDLASGQRFLIYTDGLTEATNREKESYGMKRLSALLSNGNTGNPQAIVDVIMSDIKKFTSGAPYHDDLTMLALQVT
jgi:PAS domain S-box-containing protein